MYKKLLRTFIILTLLGVGSTATGAPPPGPEFWRDLHGQDAPPTVRRQLDQLWAATDRENACLRSANARFPMTYPEPTCEDIASNLCCCLVCWTFKPDAPIPLSDYPKYTAEAYVYRRTTACYDTPDARLLQELDGRDIDTQIDAHSAQNLRLSLSLKETVNAAVRKPVPYVPDAIMWPGPDLKARYGTGGREPSYPVYRDLSPVLSGMMPWVNEQGGWNK